MTNLDYIRSMDAGQLADLMILSLECEGVSPVYVTPDGTNFSSYEEAKDYTVHWLQLAVQDTTL